MMNNGRGSACGCVCVLVCKSGMILGTFGQNVTEVHLAGRGGFQCWNPPLGGGVPAKWTLEPPHFGCWKGGFQGPTWSLEPPSWRFLEVPVTKSPPHGGPFTGCAGPEILHTIFWDIHHHRDHVTWPLGPLGSRELKTARNPKRGGS